MDQATWLTDLEAEAWTVKFLLVLLDLSLAPTLGAPFQEALIQHSNWILGDDAEPSDEMLANGHRLPKALPNQLQSEFYRQLMSRVVGPGAAPNRLRLILALHGEGLINSGALQKHADATVTSLLSPIVGEQNQEGLAWIEANESALSDATSQASADARETLREALQAAVDATDENKERLTKIGQMFELEVSSEVPWSEEE